MNVTGIVWFILINLSLTISSPGDRAWEAYLSGDFVEVEKIVKESSNDTSLAVTELARVYFALGCAEALRGREASSTLAFQHALELNRNLSYTQIELPPPVWKLYKPVKDSISSVVINLPTKQITTVETFDKKQVDTIRIFIEKDIPRISKIKSLAFPGWGHLAEQRPRGKVIFITECALIGGLVYAINKHESARRDYLGTRNTEAIKDSYKDYNFYYRLKWGLGSAVFMLYLYTQYDFFVSSSFNNENIPEVTLSFYLRK